MNAELLFPDGFAEFNGARLRHQTYGRTHCASDNHARWPANYANSRADAGP